MNIEIISSITNIVLSIVTVGSLYIAYKTLSLNKSFNDRQLNILSKPTLFLSIFNDQKIYTLELTNLSNIPAYDIDIILVSVFNEEDLALKDFIKKYLRMSLKYKVNSDKEGFYYLYDRLYYQIWPLKKQLKTPIITVNAPDQLFVLTQYRDIFGNNYAQEYWFTKSLSDSGHNKYLKLCDLQPIPISKTSHIAFKFKASDFKVKKCNDYISSELQTEDKSPLSHFVQGFNEMIKHSLPSGYTNVEMNQSEDRGEWKDI